MKVICICPVVSGRLLECCDVAFVVNYTARNVAVYASIGPTGWARKTGPQTRDHNSVKSLPIYNVFSLKELVFAGINVSQASVAKYARRGGIFNMHSTTNLPRNLPVKIF